MSALDENIMRPALAATKKATQVQGSISAASSLNGRSRWAYPRRRRSTVMIEPTTSTSANTCTVSMVGNSQSDSRIWVGNFKSCSQVRACSTAMRYTLHIGYPTSRGHDARADDDSGYSDRPGGAAAHRRFGPVLRIPAHARLHHPQDGGKRRHQEHFHAKYPVEQLARRLRDGQEDAAREQHTQCRPDPRCRFGAEHRQRLCPSGDTHEPKTDDVDGCQQNRNGDDMHRLHQRDKPICGLKRHADTGPRQPIAELLNHVSPDPLRERLL